MELGLPRRRFSKGDQTWVVENAGSHPEIEKMVLRILQIREVSGNLNAAAERLGMHRWSLDKWVKRWNPPIPPDSSDRGNKA